MARLNVYVPDDLAAAARQAGLNVSALTQRAIGHALATQRTDTWLDEVAGLPPSVATTEVVTAALDAARDDLGDVTAVRA